MLKIVWRLIVLAAANALAIYICSRIIPGVKFLSGITALLELSLILAAINYFIKPVIELILKPFIWLTLGILSIVINILVLKVGMHFIPGLIIPTVLSLILVSFIISLVNSGIRLAFGKH